MNLLSKFDTKAQSTDWAFFMTFCCFNHHLEPKDISESWFRQRAFQFGDGHFTTAKIENGQIIWWPLHLKRLQLANQILKILDIEWQQLSYVCQTMSKPIESGYIKIQISRGESSRGYGLSDKMTPSLFITANETDFLPVAEVKAPLSVAVLQTQLGHNPQLAGLKHSNRIEQSLIQAELNEYKETEGIVADINGNLIESSKGNVFWLEGNQWYTPALDMAGIDGVYRQWLLAQKPEISIVKKPLIDVIEDCEAMFISNAITGAVPVKTIIKYDCIDNTQNSSSGVKASNLRTLATNSVEELLSSTKTHV